MKRLRVEMMQKRIGARSKRGKYYGRFLLGILICVILLGSLCMMPMRAKAYFGKNEDYLLKGQKPKERGAGQIHGRENCPVIRFLKVCRI